MVNARSYWTQCEELVLKAITFNIMLISVFVGFLQSRTQLNKAICLAVAPVVGGLATRY